MSKENKAHFLTYHFDTRKITYMKEKGLIVQEIKEA